MKLATKCTSYISPHFKGVTQHANTKDQKWQNSVACNANFRTVKKF